MSQAEFSTSYALGVAEETLQELKLVQSIGHRGEAGRAREGILRRLIRRICPPSLGLDTGFVVDGIGGISGQADLVLYRPDYYPVLEVGTVKHFLVESVIATFEVKATVDSQPKLQRALEQIASVKNLDRTGGGSNYAREPLGAPIDPEVFHCQVFGALLAESLMPLQSTMKAVEGFCESSPRRLWPNIVLASRELSVRYIATNGSPSEDPAGATGLVATEPDERAEPSIVDLAVALANIVRVSMPIDFNPSNYWPSSTNFVQYSTFDDDRFPGRRDSGPSLEDYMGSG